MERAPVVTNTANLIDILDRVLDKGLVIAGDIRISLANVELLTIRIRLLVCSVEKAEQIGMNWWRFDPNLTVGARTVLAPGRARTQVRLTGPVAAGARKRPNSRPPRREKKATKRRK